MPEVILPCPNPKCGSKFVMTDTSTSGADIVKCCTCFIHGPYSDTEESAITAWNNLPRALTWTHEPPKVAGWYWRKETAKDRAHVFHFTGNWEDYGEHWESDRVCQLPLNLSVNLWAGPIPAPID